MRLRTGRWPDRILKNVGSVQPLPADGQPVPLRDSLPDAKVSASFRLCDGGEELCQELYCSRGTMFRHLGSVKDILKTFDLTLKNKRGFLTVEGDE